MATTTVDDVTVQLEELYNCLQYNDLVSKNNNIDIFNPRFLVFRRQIVELLSRLKADQINILRKQYDAFLEEDKKRKERNECILEKLDQIRLSNTVTRYKSNIYLDHRVSFKCPSEAPTAYDHPQTDNAPKQPSSGNHIGKYKDALITTEIDVLPKVLDERYLINEISKKYILIPKLRSFVSEDYIPRAIKQDNNNDNDWKSKYSILDKLKQNEKGEIGYCALHGRNENYVDHIPSREPKFGNDEKSRDVAKDKDDTYFEQYVSNPPANVACSKDEGEAKRNYSTKNEGIIETQKFDTSPKLNSKISKDSKVATELHRLQPDHDTAATEMTTPEYTHPIQNDHAQESAIFKNIDGQHKEPIYNDKHESEASEKVSGENINHVEVVNTVKATVQETVNEKHNMGAPDTLEYTTEDVYVKDFTPATDAALADVVNIHPDGYTGQQSYLAPSDQYVSEPTAKFEQVYQPGEQSIGDDQYVSEHSASAEQVYLPGVNQSQGNDHYVSEPISAEQQYMPGTDHSPDGDQQNVSEPTVVEAAYVSGDNITTSKDQHVTEPVAADTEQKDYTIENEGLQITSEETRHDLPIETVTSEIAEFEAEPNEMFYSEQANYEGYNQAAEGGEYNAESTGYDPALYYQQEAAYPVEINEHEETSQRYDPSYEQQYANQGAVLEYAEQQQYGDQQQYGEQQQYDEQQYAEQQYGEQQSELGGTMYVYDQVPSETVPETPIVEQVQQELDSEVFDRRNAAGDVVEGSTVYMQNPDVAATEPYAEQQSPEKES